MGLPARDLKLQDLRGVLAERFPDAMPLGAGTVATVATGVDELDDALPNGGLPRACLSTWRAGGGAAATLRSACVAAVVRGERAAWVDAAGTVTGEFWPAGVLLVRPEGETAALSAAEELLRSGGFAVVVVGGVGAGAERESVRLSRIAREGGGALVLLGEATSSSARLRLGSRYVPESHVWHPDPFGELAELESLGVEVEARAMGWAREVRFNLPVKDHAYRLSLDPRLVDRRGAADRDVRAALEQAAPGGEAKEKAAGGSDVTGIAADSGGLAPFDATRRSGLVPAGGGTAGSGAEGGGRSGRPDLGRRGWPGREPGSRRPAPAPRRRRVG